MIHDSWEKWVLEWFSDTLSIQMIKNLNEQLQQARSATAPRRRFAFKKAETQSPAPDVLDGETLSEQRPSQDSSKQSEPDLGEKSGSIASNNGASTHESSSPDTASTLTISSLSLSQYVLQPDDFRPAVQITDIRRSFIDLSISMNQPKPFSTMIIKGVVNSLWIGGQINGAAHITDVENSTLVLQSHQVRIHNCRGCVVYLRCNSKPVIEHCDDMKFAPLPKVFVSLGTVCLINAN